MALFGTGGAPGSPYESYSRDEAILLVLGLMSETVMTGETGLLVTRGDFTALAAHLKRLLASSDSRLKMGEAGRIRFEKEFSFQTMRDKAMKVYRDVRSKNMINALAEQYLFGTVPGNDRPDCLENNQHVQPQ